MNFKSILLLLSAIVCAQNADAMRSKLIQHVLHNKTALRQASANSKRNFYSGPRVFEGGLGAAAGIVGGLVGLPAGAMAGSIGGCGVGIVLIIPFGLAGIQLDGAKCVNIGAGLGAVGGGLAGSAAAGGLPGIAAYTTVMGGAYLIGKIKK